MNKIVMHLPSQNNVQLVNLTLKNRRLYSFLNNCIVSYSENPQYLFYCLDGLEEKVVNSTKQSIIYKYFQSDISVGQLTNRDNVRNIITDDQLPASSKKILQECPGYTSVLSII